MTTPSVTKSTTNNPRLGWHNLFSGRNLETVQPSTTSPGSTRRLSRARLASLLTTVVLIAAACGNKPLDTMAPNSPIGGEINRLFWGVMIVAGVVFVLVQGAVIYMWRRFRVKPTDDPSMLYPDEEFPEQIHGNNRLEVSWTIIPTIMMAVTAVFTLFVLVQLDEVDAQETDRIDRVTVVGHQWWWEYHYYLADNPDEVAFVTANEIVLPVDEELRLDITSRDVIHSFWIPRLNGKRDAVPGRSSPWTLEASKPDRFLGQCTEFCGLSHAYMRMYAIAIPPDQWDDWAANQAAARTPLVEGDENFEGQELFLQNCASCHVINGVTSINTADDSDAIKDDWSIYGWEGDTTAQKRIIPDVTLQVSGAAPNLTHLMTRTSFAGSIFDLYDNAERLSDDCSGAESTGPDRCDSYADLPAAGAGQINRGQLEAWIRNAPAEKANAWNLGEAQRGMTPFTGLTGEQVDAIVDYLITLD